MDHVDTASISGPNTWSVIHSTEMSWSTSSKGMLWHGHVCHQPGVTVNRKQQRETTTRHTTKHSDSQNQTTTTATVFAAQSHKRNSRAAVSQTNTTVVSGHYPNHETQYQCQCRFLNGETKQLLNKGRNSSKFILGTENYLCLIDLRQYRKEHAWTHRRTHAHINKNRVRAK